IEGRLEHGAERLTAVLVRERKLAAHHQELPLAGVDQPAAQYLFDRLRSRALGTPRLDAADDATEIVERVSGHATSVGQRAQERPRRALGPAAHFVHGPDARGTAVAAGARLECLEPAAQEVRQDLEQVLGETDAAGVGIVE